MPSHGVRCPWTRAKPSSYPPQLTLSRYAQRFTMIPHQGTGAPNRPGPWAENSGTPATYCLAMVASFLWAGYTVFAYTIFLGGVSKHRFLSHALFPSVNAGFSAFSANSRPCRQTPWKRDCRCRDGQSCPADTYVTNISAFWWSRFIPPSGLRPAYNRQSGKPVKALARRGLTPAPAAVAWDVHSDRPILTTSLGGRRVIRRSAQIGTATRATARCTLSRLHSVLARYRRVHSLRPPLSLSG